VGAPAETFGRLKDARPDEQLAQFRTAPGDLALACARVEQRKFGQDSAYAVIQMRLKGCAGGGTFR
jgi:hypothetical protein